jgi:large subunit ribosomal protein L3
MIGILGKKIGMTQVFDKDGRVIPVTVIESADCSVLQIKTEKTDGYNAIQFGLESVKESKVKKSLGKRFKKIKVSPKRVIREIPVNRIEDYKVGQVVDVAVFKPGDFVDIVGTSKGCGFQGGIKRWHWKRGPMSHGSMSHRAPGSIGASAYPSRVVKGHHLPGHMGNQKVSVQNLELITVDKDKNILIVKGSVPGHNNSYLTIKKAKKRASRAAAVQAEAKEQKPQAPEQKPEAKKAKTEDKKKKTDKKIAH